MQIGNNSTSVVVRSFALAQSDKGENVIVWLEIAPQHPNDMAHDARLINDAARGIRCSGRNLLLTPEMRRRYPHLNTRYDD